MKILFAASEAHPLVKTGGLGDVCGALPAMLKRLRHDVRLVLPAYRGIAEQAGKTAPVAELSLESAAGPVRILEGRLPGTTVKLYLVDSPFHFGRPGGPYTGPDGRDWPDNAARFALFARAVVAIARGRAGLDWLPELVHCHDWQAGLVPALLELGGRRPATVFTIHNLAYQGLFSWEIFQSLGLPWELWSMHAMEFYGQFSFIKGGLVFADRLTTVSPTYAREIQTPEFGYGLEGLLRHRARHLAGILNGADYRVWDPARDPFIEQTYNARSLRGKAADKAALQRHMGLPEKEATPLVGYIGRLVEQKGIDLILAALPEILARDVQVVVLGRGEARFEQALAEAAARHEGRLAVHLGYDEALAHRIEAGTDLFLMPSRFEPCGLNQIYSLRYGTVPVVRRTGGLADTVVDVTAETLERGTATGFQFHDPTPEALAGAVERALGFYKQPKVWRRLMLNGMRQDFSWNASARRYLALYEDALAR